MLTKLKKWLNRSLAKSSAPTKPAPSMFSNDHRQQKIDKANKAEMERAVIKEQNRRSGF